MGAFHHVDVVCHRRRTLATRVCVADAGGRLCRARRLRAVERLVRGRVALVDPAAGSEVRRRDVRQRSRRAVRDLLRRAESRAPSMRWRARCPSTASASCTSRRSTRTSPATTPSSSPIPTASSSSSPTSQGRPRLSPGGDHETDDCGRLLCRRWRGVCELGRESKRTPTTIFATRKSPRRTGTTTRRRTSVMPPTSSSPKRNGAPTTRPTTAVATTGSEPSSIQRQLCLEAVESWIEVSA